MDVPPRRQRALALLEQTGMPRGSYAAPVFRLLWRLGVDVPPPHFMGFWAVAALSGLWFGFIWGCLMWLLVWSYRHIDLRLGLLVIVGTGVLFGLAMGMYYGYGRKRHALPSWKSLGEP